MKSQDRRFIWYSAWTFWCFWRVSISGVLDARTIIILICGLVFAINVIIKMDEK